MTEHLAGYTANYAHRGQIDFGEAALTAAVCAARWANRVHLWPVGYPRRFRVERKLPPDARDAAALVDDLWRRLRKQIENDEQLSQSSKVGVVLFQGQEVVLDLHDGPGCCLHVGASRFDQLRQCWRESGFPQDLYLPDPPRIVLERAEHE